MSYANLECNPKIDWREYFKYERLRKVGCSKENIAEVLNPKKCSAYEQIFLEYIYRK